MRGRINNLIISRKEGKRSQGRRDCWKFKRNIRQNLRIIEEDKNRERKNWRDTSPISREGYWKVEERNVGNEFMKR